MNKTCTKCNISKDINDFRSNSKASDGHSTWCKSCFKQYDINNKKIISKRKSLYYISNKNIINEKHNSWYHNNKLLNSKRAHNYYLKNKNHILELTTSYTRNKRKTDSNFRIIDNIRRRINSALKNNSKSNRTINLLGASIKKVKNHLQQTAINNDYKDFDIDNYSGREYHIDHVIPCAAFNLKCSYHQRLCFNYTNLQILTKEKNLKKSDNYKG